MTDCEKCMRTTPPEIRQRFGCGYEPPTPRPEVWTHDSEVYTQDDPTRPTTCRGYTVTLPEVIEASRARLHWSKGQLEVFTRSPPAESLVLAVEILEGSVLSTQDWMMKNPPKEP